MKIDIEITAYHKIVKMLSLAVLAGTFLSLLVFWNQIPDQIPGHFNGAGEIDRWGSKAEIWVCPVIALFYMYQSVRWKKYRKPGILQ